MSKSSKKSFAIIAIIVGAIGVGLGTYTITTVGSMLDQPPDSSTESNGGSSSSESASPLQLPPPPPPPLAGATEERELHPLALNGSPLLGSPDAPITIVEYGDYQCPKCGRFATEIKPMIVENYINTGKAKLVFKDLPIYGNDSVNGAIAARCGGEQGMFWEMHDEIYGNQMQINSGWLSGDAAKRFASDIGLDIQQFSACLDAKRYFDRVEASFNDARSAGVAGTPTFLIIDSKGEIVTITGAQPFSVFSRVLDSMLE